MKKKILILCTGNSCRSQMAEGFLRHYGPELRIFSAGTYPAEEVNPNSIAVMKEVGINISSHKPEDINNYLNLSFDYVITVCDNAKEACPKFNGKVKEHIHIGFEDPIDAKGSKEEKLEVYRKVRDEIRNAFKSFYDSKLKKKNKNTESED